MGIPKRANYCTTREPAQGWTPYAPRHRRPGFHKIAAQFGVATGTVQRIAHG